MLGNDEGLSSNKGQFMYWCSSKTGNVLQRNTEARSCNHCWRGRVISITYTVCVFGALGIQRAVRMHHIVVCGMSGSATFFFAHYLIIGKFSKKNIEHEMCVWIFLNL